MNAKFRKKDVPNEDLFCMIKVGEVSLKKDKENLKSYDLVFVPGVNEYNLEKDNINEKPSKDKAEGVPPPPLV